MKKYLDQQGRKLCTYIYGDAHNHTLVLLHGFCEDSNIWEHMIPQLSEHMRVVCIDLPGFGESEPFPIATEVHLENYTSAVVNTLVQLRINDAVVVGHSLGGYIALSVAQKHGVFMHGVGLINSHPMADTELRREMRTKTIKLLQAGGQRQFVKQLIASLFSTEYALKNPEKVAELIKNAEKYPAEGIIAATIAMRDRSDYLETITTTVLPVLMVLGKQDHLIPESVQHQMIHLPQTGKVLTLPNVAHMAMFEASSETQTALIEFVDFCNQFFNTTPK